MDFTHRESLLISGATRAQERLDATERQAQLAAAELGDLMPTLRRLSGGEAPAGELTGKARELAGVRLSLAQVRATPRPPPLSPVPHPSFTARLSSLLSSAFSVRRSVQNGSTRLLEGRHEGWTAWGEWPGLPSAQLAGGA